MNGKQLKNSILQWAIQGKLVPQDPNDEPASVLLEKIRAEKVRLVKEGKLKNKDLEVKPIAEDEIPFEIPKGWVWCRIIDIFQILNGDRGKNYPSKSKLSTSGIPFISALNLKNNTVVQDEDLLCLTETQYNKLGNGKLKYGDMVVCIRGSLGKHGIYPFEQGAIASSLVIVRQYTSYDFLYKYLNVYLDSPLFVLEISNYDNGTAQPNLAAESFKHFMIPVPPLAEQSRITDKIEELIPLVEKYGETQETLEEWNNSLPEKLKKSILQEAIQGKLVPQDPNDEPASMLLERIREEKKQLVKEGKLKKKDLEVKPIEEDEVPFEIPESWEWCRIEDITLPIGNKSNQIQSKEVLNEGDVPVVSQGQKLIDGYSNEINKTIKELPVIMFGDHTRNVKLIDFPFVIGADGTKFFKPILCEAQYLYYVVLYVASKLRDRGYARHYTLLKEEPLPLPPLAEQRRIVAKIEELFGVIKK